MTSGGRVLAVTSYASNLNDAVRAAYAGVGTISFEGKYYRGDIAHRYVYFLFLPLHFSPS
jgi:phosphoribosylamine--glycine ligase/phosphoribosylformylglycinamidine cyclo-ligase